MRLGLAPILDYTFLSQDEENIDQVGVQEDAFQVRLGRIQARGTIFANEAHPWRYLFSFEYKGLDSDPDETWNITDLAVTIPAQTMADDRGSASVLAMGTAFEIAMGIFFDLAVIRIADLRGQSLEAMRSRHFNLE